MAEYTLLIIEWDDFFVNPKGPATLSLKQFLTRLRQRGPATGPDASFRALHLLRV